MLNVSYDAVRMFGMLLEVVGWRRVAVHSADEAASSESESDSRLGSIPQDRSYNDVSL